MTKINLVVIYQVIMHYRVPFYLKMQNDPELDFCVFYGKGKQGTKLVNANNLDDTINSEKIPGVRIDIKGNSFPFSPILFYKLIRKNPSVVLSEGSSSLINGTISFLYAKLFKKKFVWWSLGQLEGKKNSGLRKIISRWENFIEKKSDAIFTYSSRGKRYFLSRGVDEQKIFVGVNVLDADSRLKENNVLEKIDFPWADKFNLVFIGTITKEKNLELVIDAITKLNKEGNDYVFHIIGDGKYLNTLKNYIESNNIDPNTIVLHGRIMHGAGRIIQKCNLMVLPGLGGLAICEGMMNGLPIITGIADGTEYDLVDERNGFVIPNLTSDILIEKIQFLKENDPIRKSMGAESFRKITEELSFENYYKNFKQMLDYLISK